MELLDIYDENMKLLGQAERELAHAQGMLHPVVHVWILSQWNGEPALVFQQRAFDKKDFPGYYDLAVGGHVDVGEAMLTSALREMREEIGLEAEEKDLTFCGIYREECRLGAFYNREFAHVYLYREAAPCFHPGPEVARMVWVTLEEYKKKQAGEPVIYGWTQAGEKITIACDQWCVHAEQERDVLEWIRM